MEFVGYTVSPIPAWIQKSCQCFDCVAPVLFRVKIVHSETVSFLCLRTASSAITISAQSVSGCRTCSIGQVLLSAQGSHPASRELKSCVPSEAFLSWGHLDVDGSLNSSSLECLAMSTTMVSSHLMAWWSFHVCSATADFSRVPFQ